MASRRAAKAASRPLSASQLLARRREARFHGASGADANGLLLPEHEEAEMDSAKRQTLRTLFETLKFK